MKKKQLLEKIEALERRIAAVEARPFYQMWPTVISPSQSPTSPQITWGPDTYTVTCSEPVNSGFISFAPETKQ